MRKPSIQKWVEEQERNAPPLGVVNLPPFGVVAAREVAAFVESLKGSKR